MWAVVHIVLNLFGSGVACCWDIWCWPSCITVQQ